MEQSTWPAGGGETGELIRNLDWAATPAGRLEDWSVRLRTLVELVLLNPAPCALVWGEDGTLIYNDGYAAICGNKHPGVLGGSLRDAWPEAWEFNGSMLDNCRAGKAQVFQNACFALERDGVVRDSWFDLYYAPVGGDGSRYEGALATVVEITDRVVAEQQREAQARDLLNLNAELDSQRARLEMANRRLAGDMQFISNLFQSSPSFMAVLIGPDHRYELTNAAYDDLVQHRVVRGRPLNDVLPEIAEQGFVRLLDQVYRSGEPFHGSDVQVMFAPDGGGRERRIVDFMFQPLKNDDGQTYGILVEGVDVTARALAEERLRVAQEAGGIGTFEWYPLRKELEVSDTYRNLWGIAPGEPVTDELLLSLVDADWLEHSGVHRFGRVPNPLEYSEFPIRRADTGERRWIARRGQRVSVQPQEEPRYLGVAFDISDRRKVEAQLRELNESLERTVSNEVAERIKAEGALRHAQKMEAVGQLASGVAHDFNNVLQIISSNLQLVQRDAASSGRTGERLAQALAAVARGSRLSLQLLAFGRKQALQPAITHFGLLLEDIAPLLQRALGDGVALCIDIAPGLWSVAVDRNQLENAILNMAINARDAMQGSGQLRIAVANAAAADGGERVAVTLADNGCGMPPEVLAQVFDPFYSTKEAGKGTGLGMSMVYGFVKQSGGSIRIDSTPGAGTVITIELPRVHGEHASDKEAQDVGVQQGRETILLVDDDPAIRVATADMLAGLGYRVLTAANGEQALDILRSNAVVDLLFSDVSMPGQVTSSALVRQGGSIAPAMAVLLTSGHAVERSLLDECMPADVALLPKPYSLAQLAQALRHALDGRAHAHAVAPVQRASAAPAALRLLVVEDDAGSCALACEMLEALGYEAQGVASAEEALERLAQSPVDVLFTDLHLPGMAGDELAAHAQAIQPSLRVILASGEGVVEVAGAAGPVLLLPKPYDLVQLQETLSAVERAHAGNPGARPHQELLSPI